MSVEIVQPVYSPDTPLKELCTSELLLASTLRLFAMPYRKPEQNHLDWRGGLRAAGLAPWAAISFSGLFGIVVLVNRRPLDVRCPQARLLGFDEGRLLQLVSLFQHNRLRDAEAVLSDWLPPVTIRLAMPALEGLATAFEEGNLVIPLRPLLPVPLDNYAIQANRGIALIH